MDTPLAESELRADEDAKTLNFTSFVYKTYKRGSLEVRVYIAYWAPAKIDPEVVWIHRPDVCWTGQGGIVNFTDPRCRMPTHNPASPSLPPGRYQKFQFASGKEEVIYWHLYGGRLTDFPGTLEEMSRDRLRRFLGFAGSAIKGARPQDQLMIRISTNQTFEALMTTTFWDKLAESLLPAFD